MDRETLLIRNEDGSSEANSLIRIRTGYEVAYVGFGRREFADQFCRYWNIQNPVIQNWKEAIKAEPLERRSCYVTVFRNQNDLEHYLRSPSDYPIGRHIELFPGASEGLWKKLRRILFKPWRSPAKVSTQKRL